MLRNFLKNKKAQNTAEYALLIALVVAAVIAMQTFAQRELQARIHDAALYMANVDSNTAAGLGNDTQYEPYYLNSSYNVNSETQDDKRLGQGIVGSDSSSNRTRTGSEGETFNSSDQDSTQ